MRKSIVLISIFIISCGNNKTVPIPAPKVDTQQIKSRDTTSTVPLPEATQFTNTSLYVWQLDFDHKTKKINPNFKKQLLNVDTIIKGLNELYPNIKIEKVKIGHDTLYTEINNSQYLTEQLGSSGAEFYLAEAVTNLTSVKGVKYVNIHFNEGSHASPGVWSLHDFSDYKAVH